MKTESSIGRQTAGEAQARVATVKRPANAHLKFNRIVPGAPITENGRHRTNETHPALATAKRPAIEFVKPSEAMPGAPSSLDVIVEDIRAHHRQRRFAMGIQQVLDRKLESYVRINHTEWQPDGDEKARTKANKEVGELIKRARDGTGNDDGIALIVTMSDEARKPADRERKKHEKAMESLAAQLPVAPWVESVPGFGMLGLATIVAETGNLSNYANVAKVWKRLGFAPFDGHAGSTWKRDSWRPRKLTAEEWTDNPFSGKRDALIHQIAVWLRNKQSIGAAKTDDGIGRPDGPYGEIYAKRRTHTANSHSDWSKGHAHMDALRIMMKKLLADLWSEWNK